MSSVQPSGLGPPATASDDGSPSDSLSEDARRVLRLIEDERHLCAESLYKNLKGRLAVVEEEVAAAEAAAASAPKPRIRLRQNQTVKEPTEKQKQMKEAKAILARFKDALDDLEQRCRLFRKAKQNLEVDDDWLLAQTLFGVTTYYRREGDGSLSIKMEGQLEGVPLFDQVAVLREADLHCKWAPFCSSSLTIAHLNKLDTVGWFVVGLPTFGLMRDACFRAIGCDSIFEDGSILLVAQGIADGRTTEATKAATVSKSKGNDTSTTERESDTAAFSSDAQEEFNYLLKEPKLNELDLPEAPTRIGSGRMTIRTFQATIHVESPTLATTRIIANIDPNLPFIPQSLLDFVMKKLCGVLLSKLQGAAKKVSKDPINNPHACKMRQEEDFYNGWLTEKFRAVCKVRGWTMPPVSAFDLTDQQRELAEAADAKKTKGMANQAIKLYHSLSEDKLDDFLDPAAVPNSEDNARSSKGPRLRALSDSDSVSELSGNSASTMNSIWKTNPIAAYMREIEEKTQMRKARAIEESRERAANRLKRKSLDDSAKSRLEELRAARQKRLASKLSTRELPIEEEVSRSSKRSIVVKSKPRREWEARFARHGKSTRVSVIVFLVSLLYTLLYVNTNFATPGATTSSSSQQEETTWWTELSSDFAMVVYLVFVGCVHFLLCYITLMYEFTALQIGSIAGQQARKFYNESIHILLGSGSAGMVLIGITKASVTAFFRWLKSQTLRLLGYLWQSLSTSFGALSLPYPISRAYDVVSAVTAGVWSIVGSILYSLLQSNFVGRSIYGMLDRSGSETISQYGGEAAAEDVIPWREDAFATTRALLAYSATFLLLLVVIFNLSAKQARVRAESSDLDETLASETSDSSTAHNSAASGSRDVVITAIDTTPRSLPLRAAGGSAEPQSPASDKTPASDRTPRKTMMPMSPPFDPIEEGSNEGGAAAGEGKSPTSVAKSEGHIHDKTKKKKKRRIRLFAKSKKTL